MLITKLVCAILVTMLHNSRIAHTYYLSAGKAATMTNAPTTKSATTPNAPTTKASTTPNAPTTKAPTTPNAPTTIAPTTPNAPTTKAPTTPNALTTKSARTPNAPTTKAPTAPNAPTTKAPTTPNAPTTKATTMPNAPTTKAPTTPNAPTTKAPTTPNVPTTKSATTPNAPTTKAPTAPNAPTIKAPTTPNAPTTKAPTTPNTPTTKAPTTPNAPTIKAPTTPNAPTTKSATTPNAPTTKALTTPNAPTTKAPTTPNAPTTKAPTTPNAPTTKAPTTPNASTTKASMTPNAPINKVANTPNATAINSANATNVTVINSASTSTASATKVATTPPIGSVHVTTPTLSSSQSSPLEVFTPNLGNAEFHLNFTLKFNLTYSNNLTVKTSPEYQTYSSTFKKKLYDAYHDTGGFQGITINGFREGSVICNYTVIYAATVDISVLTTALNGTMKNILKDLKVLGQKADENYLDDHFSKELAKATRQLSSVCNAVDVCPIGYNCTDENGSVTCHYKCADFTCNNEETCNIDSDGNPYCRCNTVGKFIFGGKKCEQLILTDVVIYIAAGGGGGLLLILTVALICTCVMKGKWKENSSKVSPTKDANLSANGSFVHLPSPTKDHWNTNNHHNGRQRDEYEMIDLARPSDGYDRQQDPVYRDGVPVRHSYADTEVLERRVRDEVRRHDHKRQMSQQYRHTDEVTRGQGHFEARAVDLGYVSRDDRPMSYNDEGLVQDYRAGIPRVQISRSEEQPLAHNVEDHGLRASVGYLGPIDRFPSPEANRLVYPQSQERYVEPPSPLKRFTDAESTQSSGRYSRRLDVSHGRQESNGEIRRHENGRGFGNQDDERPIRRQENDWSVGRQDSSRDTRRQENGMDRRRQETERDLRRNESSREIRRQEYGRDSGRHEINRETKHRGSDRLQEDRRHLEQRRYSEGKMLGNLHRPHSFVAEPESLVFSIGNNSIQIPEADYDANQEHSSESNSANTPLDRRSRDYDYNRPHQIPSQYGVNNSPMARQLRKRAEEIGMRRNLGHDERPSPRVARKPVPDMSRDSRYSQQDRQYSGLRASRR